MAGPLGSVACKWAGAHDITLGATSYRAHTSKEGLLVSRDQVVTSIYLPPLGLRPRAQAAQAHLGAVPRCWRRSQAGSALQTVRRRRCRPTRAPWRPGRRSQKPWPLRALRRASRPARLPALRAPPSRHRSSLGLSLRAGGASATQRGWRGCRVGDARLPGPSRPVVLASSPEAAVQLEPVLGSESFAFSRPTRS